MKKKCKSNAHEAADYARRFPRGHWSFLGPGSEKKLSGTYSDKPDKSSEDMMLDFAETIHPLSRASSALERGELRSKGGDKKTVHFNGSEQNVELILRQLSINGAVADMCTEVSKDTMASGKPEAHAAQDPLETVEIPTEPPAPNPRTDEHAHGNLLQEYEQQFEQQSDAQKLSKLCSNAGSKKNVERGQYFITLATEGPSGMVHLCREYTLLRNDLRSRARGWIRKNTKIGPVWNVYVCVCHHEDRYSIEIQVRSLFQDRTASWVRNDNGIEKYANETTETMEDEEHEALGKPIAKARTRMKSTITLTPVSVPLRERKWVEVNRGSYDHECYVTSKAMTRLLRHDQNIPRETDG